MLIDRRGFAANAALPEGNSAVTGAAAEWVEL